MDAAPFLRLWGEDEAGENSQSAAAQALSFERSDHGAVATVSEKASKSGHLASASGDPNDLPLQRWGVVAPEGPEGDRLLELVKGLRAHRGAQQGEEPVVYRVKAGMDTAEAEAFMDGEYWDKVERSTERLPRYLLLLGDPDRVSWSLQQTLGRHGAFPGRLSFSDPAGYAAYVNKLIRWEKAAMRQRDALFYVARDNSSAVESARKSFLAPTAEKVGEAAARDYYKDTLVEVRSVGLEPCARPEEELEMLLALAGKTSGAAMATVSHGVGLPAGASDEQRRARREKQGGLSVSQKCALFADRVKSGPFLPGGAWFFFACFSAGTPAESAYSQWLGRLRGKEDHRAAKALSTLAGAGEAPFVAALPQAALANPDGPLAVVGHVDLAWSWSYEAVRDGGVGGPYAGRSERLSGLLHAWLSGDRFGPAHHVLSRAATTVGEGLLSRYAQSEGGKAPAGEDWQSQTAYLWLEYQDLNGYVLAGDPAAALPGSRVFAQTAPQPRAVARVERADLDTQEQAALLALRTPADIDKLAKKVGVTAAELRLRAAIYREAGRRALSAHLDATGARGPKPT